MKEKFTMGPWFYDSYLGVDGSVRVVKGNITISCFGGATESDIANAKLISAAPCMYEALKEVSTVMRESKISYSMVDKIDQILSEARGEE